MDDYRSIERFLNCNSTMTPRGQMSSISSVTQKTKYRPDKVFNRDALMKWNMILNGIDTPHRLAPNAVFAKINETWLTTEIMELKDFKI